MKRYVGTKIIQAVDEKHSESGREGYRVRYADGYESWSPKEAFEDAYRECDAMTFGLALELLKKGMNVCRAGWNGKGMWLAIVQGYDYNPKTDNGAVHALGCEKLPWIGMKTADNKFVPWLASQTDMLAEDWKVVI